MRIQIASDLHLEGCPGHLPGEAAFRPVRDRDLLILAGDIGVAMKAWPFVERELATSPVIYVPGNHEYYTKSRRADVDANWHRCAKTHPDLHYLVGEGVEIDGVRFWAAPWYSDLWGIAPDCASGARYHRNVERGINDFWPLWGGGEWSLARHIGDHLMQTDALQSQAGRVDVVITHWPPTKAAIHPKFDGDALNPYFINDKPDLVREIGAMAWISGHTHEAYDYQEGPTRCIGNPTGYLGEERQSRLFRPDRIVEVRHHSPMRGRPALD